MTRTFTGMCGACGGGVTSVHYRAQQPDTDRVQRVYGYCAVCGGPLTLTLTYLAVAPGGATDWQQAALRVGEALASDGPEGYYDFTAEQWRDWALQQVADRAGLADAACDALLDAPVEPADPETAKRIRAIFEQNRALFEKTEGEG